MKNKIENNENYLDKIPSVSSKLKYTVDEDGIVTLEVLNKGIMNRIAQKLFSKPETTYIHLDELGSFSVLCADGSKSILIIGECLKEKFGDECEPLYERLAKFFQIMDSYNFIEWK